MNPSLPLCPGAAQPSLLTTVVSVCQGGVEKRRMVLGEPGAGEYRRSISVSVYPYRGDEGRALPPVLHVHVEGNRRVRSPQRLERHLARPGGKRPRSRAHALFRAADAARRRKATIWDLTFPEMERRVMKERV